MTEGATKKSFTGGQIIAALGTPNTYSLTVALTGTPEEVQTATQAYRVYFAKKAGGSPDDYAMGHSDFIYLMSPTGEYVTHFRAEDTATDIANRIRRELLSK